MIFNLRGLGKHFIAVERRHDFISSQNVGEPKGMMCGGKIAEVERGDVGSAVEHGSQLAGEKLYFARRKVEQSKLCYMGNVVGGERR